MSMRIQSTTWQSTALLMTLVVVAAPTIGCRSASDQEPPKDGQWTWSSSSQTAPNGNPSGSESSQPRRVERANPPPEQNVNHLSSPPPPAPAPAPEPARMLTASAGSSVRATMDTSLSSETASVGQSVSATVASAVTDPTGNVVLPAGTRLSGSVTEVQSARKVHKKSILALHFTRATLPDGTSADISTGQHFEGKGYTGKDGAIIGGSAVGGALLGQVLGKGSAEGAVVGGAIGTGIVMSKKGEDVDLPPGSSLDLVLDRDVTVTRR